MTISIIELAKQGKGRAKCYTDFMEEQTEVVPEKNNFFTRRYILIAVIAVLVIAIAIVAGYYFLNNGNPPGFATPGASDQSTNGQPGGSNVANSPGQNQQSSGSSANGATVSPAAASSGAAAYKNISHDLAGMSSIDAGFQNDFKFTQSETVLPAYYLIPTETDLATAAPGNYYTKALYQLGGLTLTVVDRGVSASVNGAPIGSAAFGALGSNFNPSAAVATFNNNNIQYFTVTGEGCNAGACSTNITLATLSSGGTFSGSTLYTVSNSPKLEFNDMKGAYFDGTYTYVIFGSSGSNADIAFAIDASGNLAATITGGYGEQASSSPSIAIPSILQAILQSPNI